jgi:hypothetical protein
MRVSVAKWAVVALGIALGLGTAQAQDTTKPPAAASTDQQGTPDASAGATDDVKQIKLTEQQVQHFIAAQPDLAAIASKIQSAGDTPDPALQAVLEAIATKHGFGNFAELDDVAANISLVMAGFDPSTGEFVDLVEALKKQRDDVEKDSSIPDKDKKQLLDELSEAISTTPKLQFKENVDIVKAHKAEIEKALQ